VQQATRDRLPSCLRAIFASEWQNRRMVIWQTAKRDVIGPPSLSL